MSDIDGWMDGWMDGWICLQSMASTKQFGNDTTRSGVPKVYEKIS
jgi:hypothetical protein